MIEVIVPATSANVGPGYDCLGLALTYYGKFYFELRNNGLTIEGCEQQFQNEQNLVYTAFKETLTHMKVACQGVYIRIDSDIPLARGLGSSAACIVAGVFGANALFDNKLDTQTLFELCTSIEGHPDNIAPAIFGNLCVSYMEHSVPYHIAYTIHPNLKFLCVIPAYEVSTQTARQLLPNEMSYADAVYQMGRCAALAKALEMNNQTIIKTASKDNMHEPYRKKLIRDYDNVQLISKKNGALAMFISGSGSTMLIITDDVIKTKQMMKELQKYDMVCKELEVDTQGVRIKEVMV